MRAFGPAPGRRLASSLGIRTPMHAYGRLSTAFYDLDKPMAPTDAIAFYLEEARRSTGPVLEPMCGSGRFLVPLAAAGISVDGTDVAPEMLAACSRALSQAGSAAGLFRQELKATTLPRQYGMAFIPTGSLGLIVDTLALEESLRRLRAHLLPGGALLIEIPLSDEFDESSEILPVRKVADGRGTSITYHCRAVVNAGTRVVIFHGRYVHRSGDEVLAEETEELPVRLHRRDELMAILRRSGFSDIQDVVPSPSAAWLKDGGYILLRCLARHHTDA
jgi:Methyltransferase domain